MPDRPGEMSDVGIEVLVRVGVDVRSDSVSSRVLPVDEVTSIFLQWLRFKEVGDILES